ncbi:MAG: hypothetical protein KC457_13360 [Myxococcales bacterium]|nr:hypothetical protein [Myxococcales bacterium]
MIASKTTGPGAHMSAAEIQDNKWEREAAKPPITDFAGLGMIIMMGGFSLFFVAVLIGSIMGAFTDPKAMDFDKKQKVEGAEGAAPAQAEAEE